MDVATNDSIFPVPKYVWSKAWNSPWQSAWGYIQRFRYCNSLTVFDAYAALAPAGERNTSRFKAFGDFRLNDETRWIQILGVSLQQNRTEFINKYLWPFIDDKYIFFDQLITRQLRFCPKCITDGFHSYFHQLFGLTKCPFHNINLTTSCPNCGRTFTYGIRSDEFKIPFQCSCGWRFIKQEDGVWDIHSWSNHQKLKVNRNVFSLDLKDSFAEIFADTDLEGHNTNYHLAVYPIDTGADVPTKDILWLLNGDKVQGGLTFRFIGRSFRYRKAESDPKIYTYQFPWSMDDFYQIFKCIVRHIRKDIARRCGKKRIREIQDYVPDKGGKFEFAPDAFAYLKWKEEIEGHSAYWNVDRGMDAHIKRIEPKCEYKIRMSLPEFDNIHRIIGVITEINELNHNANGMPDLYWILKHIVAMELIRSYKLWLNYGYQLSQATLEEQLKALSTLGQRLEEKNITHKEVRAIFFTSNLDSKTFIYFF